MKKLAVLLALTVVTCGDVAMDEDEYIDYTNDVLTHTVDTLNDTALALTGLDDEPNGFASVGVVQDMTAEMALLSHEMKDITPPDDWADHHATVITALDALEDAGNASLEGREDEAVDLMWEGASHVYDALAELAE